MAELAGPFLPTSDRVALAWLASVGIPAGNCATTLPAVTAWTDGWFLQVQAIPGGRLPDIDLPRRLPILQLDGWGATPGSDKPRWNLANYPLELVREATERTDYHGKVVDLGANYLSARVWTAYLISEPARVTDDPSGYGRFTADLAIDWVRA